MFKRYMLFFLITLVLSQTSCSLHSGSTYDREEMGQPQSFSKGVIISVRNVKIKGTESGVGVISGAVVGGLAGSQVGSNDATSAIAAIGGAVVGGRPVVAQRQPRARRRLSKWRGNCSAPV